MVEQNRQLDSFFQIFSKYILILPAVLVVIIVFYKLSSANSAQLGVKDYALQVTPTVTDSLSNNLSTAKEASASVKFNLTGPLICSFSTDNDKVDAYIKDKKAFINMEKENVTNNYLLNGDCVYMWKKGAYSGEKVCSISQQVAIVDGLLSSGLLDPATVFGSLGNMFKVQTDNNSQESLNKALSSCKSESVPGTVKFDVPKNILFKNTTLK